MDSTHFSGETPRLVTPIPGPRSRALAERLRASESRGVTFLERDAPFPVFWRRGRGLTIEDVDGNRFLDATAAFGVAALGHAHPQVARALAEQAAELPHGMGDVHPTPRKVELCERLASLSPLPGATRVLLASTGAEAVEGALKTARLASGKPRILAFAGAYHGLTYGALATTAREHFRAPFRDQLRPDLVLRCGYDRASVQALTPEELAGVGTILVEPLQGRGGIVVPEPGFLTDLRTLADTIGAVLVHDEIFTGFGRTGAWFACEHEAALPDLLVVGKAMSNGFPISAVLGRAEVMDAWPTSTGEAVHTSTHLGSPLGCAAALTTLALLDEGELVENSRRQGIALEAELDELVARHPTILAERRGRGLMQGVVTHEEGMAAELMLAALQVGLLALPAGDHGEVLELTPPLVMESAERIRILELLDDALTRVHSRTR